MIKFSLLILYAILFSASCVTAEEWPSRTVRIVVPFPPGGGNDIAARILSKHLSISIKQSVIVENKPGASGTAGTKIYLTTPVDDHTFIIGSSSNIIFSPIIQKQYNVEDLEPISLLGVGSYLLIANQNTGIRSVGDLIKKAKSHNLTYASGGLNTGGHLAMMYFAKLAEIDIKHIIYPGGNPALIALARNEVDLSMLFGWNLIKQYVEQGIFVPLATTNSIPEKHISHIPPLSLFFPEFEVSLWYGMFGRKEHSKHILKILSTKTNEIISNNLLNEALINEGLESKNISSEEFKQLIYTEHMKWKKLL
jgi:tripartite-type tricarboxylate transporter receptor subunit TctC